MTSNPQHADRAHALISASSAKRWMACPPSVRLSEQFEDTPSFAAREGTYMHEMAECILRYQFGQTTTAVYEAKIAELRDNDFYNDEVVEAVERYVSFVQETVTGIRAACEDPLILIEQRLDFSDWVPGGFGTGDVVIVTDDTIEVIDLKGGRGHPVYADHNPQLMLYALGAYAQCELLFDITSARINICQPRLHSTTTFEITIAELLQWAENEVKPKALMALEGKGDFCAGDHCTFCKARFTCRTRSEYFMELAKKDFASPDVLSDSEVADILPVLLELENWASDLIAYARNRALEDGVNWPGFKLVEGRSVRRFSCDEATLVATADAAEVPIHKTVLLTLTELERACGKKKFQDLFGQYIDKPAGEPKLVPLSAPGRPVTTETAVQAFEEIH